MGYISKDIAVITEPNKVSLATNPNFIIFEAKPQEKVFLEALITVNIIPGQVGISEIVITDSDGGTHSFKGTTDLTKVSSNVFFISQNKDETTENIKNAFLSDRWISSNFDITVPFDFLQDKAINGTQITIKSKGTGAPYNISINLNPEAYTLAWINAVSKNNDSITGEEVSTEIALDIFEATGIFLGSEDRPLNSSMLGKPFTSIQKTYQGTPLWFELNALLSKKVSYNVPTSLGWCNTGTISDYRFTAKLKGNNSFPFYYSNALYVINGYGYSLSPVDLTPYIFNNKDKIKLLTNKPYGRYIRGQKEFINFIFADQNRGVSLDNAEYEIGVAYKLFTFSGQYITTVYDHEVARTSLSIVNTCVIDLSSVLEAYPNTGRVEVVLTRNRAEISESLELEIVPECLHHLNTFIFLNKLGGWDSFNVDAEAEIDNKQSLNTYYKTLTPGRRAGDSLETVYSVDLDISYSLETDLLDTATRTWLQELLASSVIFDGDGNYIIIQDAKLPISSQMDTLTLKYKLSDKYNG